MTRNERAMLAMDVEPLPEGADEDCSCGCKAAYWSERVDRAFCSPACVRIALTALVERSL